MHFFSSLHIFLFRRSVFISPSFFIFIGCIWSMCLFLSFFIYFCLSLCVALISMIFIKCVFIWNHIFLLDDLIFSFEWRAVGSIESGPSDTTTTTAKSKSHFKHCAVSVWQWSFLWNYKMNSHFNDDLTRRIIIFKYRTEIRIDNVMIDSRHDRVYVR